MNTKTQSQTNSDILYIIGMFFLVIFGVLVYGLIESADLLATTITKHTAVTNPAIALVISWFGMLVFAVVAVICTVYGYRKSVQKRKHREFLDANPDLDGRAIYRTVKHLQRHTTYNDVRFGTVGATIENARRYGGTQNASPFKLEVIRVYRHFVNPKKYPLPESYRPR